MRVPRLLAKGLAFALVLTAGVLTAYASPGSVAAAGDASTSLSTSIETATQVSTGTATGSQGGSTWLFLGVLLIVALLIGVPYGWDLYRTNKREDDFLAAVGTKPIPPSLDKLGKTQLNQLIDKATSGTEGIVRSLIAFGVLGVFTAALFYLLIKNPALNSDSVVGNAMSALITLLTAVSAFYFGTRSAQTSGAAPTDGGDDGRGGGGGGENAEATTKALTARQDAKRKQATADEAQSKADAAEEKAHSAKTPDAADHAKTARDDANRKQAEANEAWKKADEAQSAAEGAKGSHGG